MHKKFHLSLNYEYRYQALISLPSNWWVCSSTSSQVLYSAMIAITFTSLLQHFTVAIAREKFMTSLNAECRASPNIHSYVATHYYLDHFLVVGRDPTFMHAGWCRGIYIAYSTSTSHRSLKALMCAEQK